MGWLRSFLTGKHKDGLIIQCTTCAWAPAKSSRWQCSCRFVWNTFDTGGRCPACDKQWESTQCLGCGTKSPHAEWYKTPELVAALEQQGDPILTARKKRLEKRLIGHGIRDSRFRDLRYLNYEGVKFKSPREIGRRMLILYALS